MVKPEKIDRFHLSLYNPFKKLFMSFHLGLNQQIVE